MNFWVVIDIFYPTYHLCLYDYLTMKIPPCNEICFLLTKIKHFCHILGCLLENKSSYCFAEIEKLWHLKQGLRYETPRLHKAWHVWVLARYYKSDKKLLSFDLKWFQNEQAIQNCLNETFARFRQSQKGHSCYDVMKLCIRIFYFLQTCYRSYLLASNLLSNCRGKCRCHNMGGLVQFKGMGLFYVNF